MHTRGAQGLSPGDDVGGCSPSRSPPSRPPPPRTWASPLRHLLPASLPARIPSVLGNYCPASNSIWHPRVVKWGKSRAIYVAASRATVVFVPCNDCPASSPICIKGQFCGNHRDQFIACRENCVKSNLMLLRRKTTQLPRS